MWRFLTENTAKFSKKWTITLVLKKSVNPPPLKKLAESVEISDHNIDPWSRTKLSYIERLLRREDFILFEKRVKGLDFLGFL
jgi:hypothetical protein